MIPELVTIIAASLLGNSQPLKPQFQLQSYASEIQLRGTWLNQEECEKAKKPIPRKYELTLDGGFKLEYTNVSPYTNGKGDFVALSVTHPSESYVRIVNMYPFTKIAGDMIRFTPSKILHGREGPEVLVGSVSKVPKNDTEKLAYKVSKEINILIKERLYR